MARVFFPGCKVKARYPEASAWLKKQVIDCGYADEVTGCCRVKHQGLTSDDIAVCVCVNCMAMIDEDAHCAGVKSVWPLIDADPDFPLPDYRDRNMTVSVQDCGRSYDRADVQDAIRSLLRKMGIAVVEAPDARERSTYCGASGFKAAPDQDRGFAPQRYGIDAPARGMFVPRAEEEIPRLLREHAERIPADDVVCYCTACDAGLLDGGKRPVNIIELVSGCFIERPLDLCAAPASPSATKLKSCE